MGFAVMNEALKVHVLLVSHVRDCDFVTRAARFLASAVALPHQNTAGEQTGM